MITITTGVTVTQGPYGWYPLHLSGDYATLVYDTFFLLNQEDICMRKLLLASCIGALSGLAATPASASEFSLHSPDIDNDGEINELFEYGGFGCSGDNESPVLRWEDAPAGTKSFAISVHDPDAPTGSGWWHWRVVNIPADVNELAANAGAADGSNLPERARQLQNDYGEQGWGGVCPPPGDSAHRYTFTVHALDVAELELPENATPALAGFMINQHEISQAGIMATYARDEDE